MPRNTIGFIEGTELPKSQFYRLWRPYAGISKDTIVEWCMEPLDVGKLLRVRLIADGVYKYTHLPVQVLKPTVAPDNWIANDKPIISISNSILTPEEMVVLDKLAEAWNAYIQLPKQHPMHNDEFAHAIHSAQRLIMSRPVSRHYGWVKVLSPNDHG